MTTTTTTLTAPSAAEELPLAEQQHLVLENASWELYERLLKDTAGRNLRITYDQGRMEIMPPLLEHEKPSRALARMIGIATLELGIPIATLGSTTFKLKNVAKGLEPDECVYVQHEPHIRGRKRLDLRRDPPPDLALEIEITSLVVPKMPIYVAMKVPEVWRYDGARVNCLHLRRGEYRTAQKSLALPFMRPRELEPFLERLDREDETAVMRAFTVWVRAQNWPMDPSAK
jgi:Uma2 family endonuclease